MAEFILKYMAKDKADIYIESAATSTWELGNGVHYGTVDILKKKRIPNPGHRAVRMKKSDYDKYDYIIGMDEWNIRDILKITGGDPKGKVYKLLDFTERGGNIADPWYTHDFETAYRDVYEGCEGLMEVLYGKKNS